MTIAEFIFAVNAFVLCYFLALNGTYLVLYLISFVEIVDYSRREIFSGLSELFTSAYCPARVAHRARVQRGGHHRRQRAVLPGPPLPPAPGGGR